MAKLTSLIPARNAYSIAPVIKNQVESASSTLLKQLETGKGFQVMHTLLPSSLYAKEAIHVKVLFVHLIYNREVIITLVNAWQFSHQFFAMKQSKTIPFLEI